MPWLGLGDADDDEGLEFSEMRSTPLAGDDLDRFINILNSRRADLTTHAGRRQVWRLVPAESLLIVRNEGLLNYGPKVAWIGIAEDDLRQRADRMGLTLDHHPDLMSIEGLDDEIVDGFGEYEELILGAIVEAYGRPLTDTEQLEIESEAGGSEPE